MAKRETYIEMAQRKCRELKEEYNDASVVWKGGNKFIVVLPDKTMIEI